MAIKDNHVSDTITPTTGTLTVSGVLTASGGISGGGAAFPIGAIIQAPSAPTGNGTWLACDGSAVSQTTYASLYSAIGHSYLGFTGSENFNPQITTNYIFWIGNRWLALSGGSGTANAYSTDNVTWTSNGALANSTSNQMAVSNGSGTVIVFNYAGNTTANRSTDSGATWASLTLPAALTSIIWNGTNFVGFVNGSTTTYYSADGSSWTTNTSALPAAFSAIEAVWDGSYMMVMDAVGGTVLGTGARVYKTNVLTGASGWSLVTPPTGIIEGIRAVNTTGHKVLLTGNTYTVMDTAVTGDQFATVSRSYDTTSPYIPGLSGNGQVLWNGTAFVMIHAGGVSVSTDGVVWNRTLVTNYPIAAQFSGVTISGINPPGNAQSYTSNTSADTSTGKIMAGSGTYTFLMTPTPNLATQFCLPYSGNPLWIKAL